MRLCMLTMLQLILVADQALSADPRHFEDASLRCVQFVDEHEGWSAGDDGVVWHSIDGGANWERQPTGVRGSLRSIHFLNPYTGWIAGREELPNGQGSVGVLLHTTDAGLKWRRLFAGALPGLNVVRFTDDQRGFIAGDATEQFPTGMFQTIDGGKSWKAVTGPRATSWHTASFVDGKAGLLAGAWNRLALYRDGNLTKVDLETTLATRAIRGLHVLGSKTLAVGQGGQVLTNQDQTGATWVPWPTLQLSTEIRASWDFHGVHVHGRSVWIVGRPGSATLHSPDAGETWQFQQTGQPLPLNAVFFNSELRGWAVGDYGSILATQDGGKNWRVRRRGGQRAAAVFVNARPTALPIDTVASLGAEEGYLTTAVRVHCSDPGSAGPMRSTESERMNHAMRMAGGGAGEIWWQFPLPQYLARADSSELIRHWNSFYADRSKEAFMRQLVLTLRIWRPSVILTDNVDPRHSGWPCDGFVAASVKEACRLAADPAAFPEQIEKLGLETWQTAKVYGLWDSPAGAHVNLDLTRIESRLESSVADFAIPAACLLSDSPATPLSQRHYQLIYSSIKGAVTHRHLMQGVELASGGVARRVQAPVAPLSEDVVKALRTRRNLQSLAEAPLSEINDPKKLLTQVEPMLRFLPDDQAAAAAYRVAGHFARMGQWELARELYLQMVDRHAAHPLATDAYRWLIRHNTSGEARRRQELGQFWVLSQIAFGKANSPAAKVGVHDVEFTEAIQTSQPGFIVNKEEVRRWYEGSLVIGDRLAAFGPIQAGDPAVQFCLQSARRRLGEFDKAKDWYAKFRSSNPTGAWSDAAAAELWLMNRSGQPPKPVASCRHADGKPFLDGEFNDACWQSLKPLPMHAAAGDSLPDNPTEVRLCYDKDFLYVALKCMHPPGRSVVPVKARPHDADVRSHDRVTILLDVDRDYSTCFQFQIDERGCVCDDCWGDLTWNPRWFVATKNEPTCWQAEVAIPTIELSGETVSAGKSWAFNVSRIVPGRGIQAFSLPADVHPPRTEGMGLLLFIQEPRQTKNLSQRN